METPRVTSRDVACILIVTNRVTRLSPVKSYYDRLSGCKLILLTMIVADLLGWSCLAVKHNVSLECPCNHRFACSLHSSLFLCGVRTFPWVLWRSHRGLTTWGGLFWFLSLLRRHLALGQSPYAV